ncbi:MAG: O-antigen ligase family protein [Bacteroides thetaiotaomicron]|nr:O-antigen ligase family protein [Bacteroides thetaiotaomicron]
MQLYLNDKEIRPNLAFTLYFSVMFCLYTYTYIQLLAQLGIMAYVIFQYTNIKTLYINTDNLKNMRFYVCWFGFLVFAFYLSTKFWAYSTKAESNTLLTIFRIFAIGFVIFLYVDTKEKAYAVLQSLIAGLLLMGIVAIITSLLLGYGFGNTNFGTAIGQHRNQIGAISAPMVFICYYLWKDFAFRNGRIFSVFFAILALMTGSLTTIAQLGIIIIFIAIFSTENINKIIPRIVGILIAFIIAALVVRNVPYLYENIWVRIENVLQTMSGTDDYADGSTLGRQSYKTIAFIMFLNKPLLGYGLDGFYCFLRDNNTMLGFHLTEVYSHCNYAELAADLGILGLAIWYLPVLSTLRKIWKCRKESQWSAVLLSVFLSMILMDYSRIPWETHMVMYLWFIIIIICRYEYSGLYDHSDEG